MLYLLFNRSFLHANNSKMKSFFICFLLGLMFSACSKNEPTNGECLIDCFTFEGVIIDKLSKEKIGDTRVELVCNFGDALFNVDRIIAVVRTNEDGFFSVSVPDSLVQESKSTRLIFGETEVLGTYRNYPTYLDYDESDLNSVMNLDEIEVVNLTKINLNIKSELMEVFAVSQLVEITSENSPNGEYHRLSEISSSRVEFESLDEIKKIEINLFSDGLNSITFGYKTSPTGESIKITKEIQNMRGIVDTLLFEILE